MIKKRQELIKEFTKFFKSKKHKEIQNSSLIPTNDPTVLFTTAGMHPLVPYITGQTHPLGNRLVNVQKCIRTVDIDEVGDENHHTFFEMLGNWSLNNYWKEDSIKFYFEFLTKSLKIPKNKLSFSCFNGDHDSPKDHESENTLLSLKIPKERIAFFGKDENWWGPAGETGPCGTDIEIFYWSSIKKPPKKFNPKDKNWVEIGTDVFIEFNKDNKGKYSKLKQRTIDFGGGVERTIAALNNISDNYQTSMFKPIIKTIEKFSNKNYENNKKEMRIIADHIKAAVMILSEDHLIKPSNVGQGYVLRRLIRRSIRYGNLLGIKDNFTTKIALSVFPIYPDYKDLKKNKNFILTQLDEEENKFKNTLEKGINQFKKITKNNKTLSGKDSFLLFQSFGFPIEMTEELAKENKIKINIKDFHNEFKKHQELSRTSSSGTFKSGLADNSSQTKKLHTATHLLNQVLRIVLGDEVKQRGSNITPERLRFDFNFERKLTDDEIKKIENLVNEKIKDSLEVINEEMSLNDAIKSGAQSEFGHKYPSKVFVYTILDKKDKRGWFSKEICTGPHVNNTGEIGTFKIIKESSSAAGIRRIKAIVE